MLVAGRGELRAGKDAVERVVVGLRGGVVLVVVAARAAQREPEQSSADRVNGILDNQVEVGVLVIAVALGLGQEAGRDDPLGVGRVRRPCCQEVAGHLLAQELVVRLIGVEGVDDVVAVKVPALGMG